MARYCWNCGKELEDKNQFCPECGTKNETRKKDSKEKESSELSSDNMTTTIAHSDKKTNGFAIAGFVLSLVSLLCCGILSWLGLIFSIIGLVNAKKCNGEGKGLAIAGIIISAIFVLLLVLLYIFGITSVIATDFAKYA